MKVYKRKFSKWNIKGVKPSKYLCNMSKLTSMSMVLEPLISVDKKTEVKKNLLNKQKLKNKSRSFMKNCMHTNQLTAVKYLDFVGDQNIKH